MFTVCYDVPAPRAPMPLPSHDHVASGMDFLCGRTSTLVLQPAPTLPGNLGQVRCRTRVTPGYNVPTPRPTPVASTREIIRPALTSFWANFDPDQPDEEEELPDIPLDHLWAAIRMRTAPLGTDDWEPPTPSNSVVDSEGAGFSQTSPSRPCQTSNSTSRVLLSQLASMRDFTCWSQADIL